MYSKFLFLILFPLFAYSQAPQKINFQSVLRNSAGEVLSNKSVSIRIGILSGNTTGTNVYSETHSKTTDASGLMSIQIGNGTVVSGLFSSIEWGSTAYFINLEADFNGGTNFILLGTQELMSVPYALYASKTDTSVLNLVNRFNSKVNISDTSNMLSNYRTGLNAKINTTDTSTMLSNYLRKADDVIADLQFQIKQLQSLSNVIDIDGNSYKTVKIGSQIWMGENLKTSRYKNGGSVPFVVGDTAWQALTTGAWSYYTHDEANNTIYGKLYNWFSTQGDTLCPTGWRVPSDNDWTILTTYLGGESVAGGKMKSIGTTYWRSPNTGATNESGFSGLPGGYRRSNGSFHFIRNIAFFWSATEYDSDFAWFRNIASFDENVRRYNSVDIYNKSIGHSVRCLKD